VGSSPCGGGGLSVSEFTVTKSADRATVDFLSAIQSGTIFTEIVVRYVTPDGGGGLIDYQTYRFKSAALTGYSTSSGGDRPSESLSIYFSEVEIEYVHIDSKGGLSPETMTLTAPACSAF
jgi:type VI secretion system secreted protein Hcp